MARKKSSPTRPGDLPLMDRITQIVIAVGDGPLSPPQWMKIMGLYADGARAGEALMWMNIDSGNAKFPSDADTALLLLALYTKAAMEAIPGHEPGATDASPDEVAPVMQQILALPGWEPSARWPFSKKEMSKNLHRLGPYLIDGFDIIPQANEVMESKMRKMN